MFISGVNDTGDKWEKFLSLQIFHILLRAYLSPLNTCRMNFCLVFIFRPRQAGIVSTVLSPVLLTPAKNLSAGSMTPVNNFSAVPLTQAINLRFFGYFWPVSTTPGTKFIAGENDTAKNCLPVSLIPLTNFSPVIFLILPDKSCVLATDCKYEKSIL